MNSKTAVDTAAAQPTGLTSDRIMEILDTVTVNAYSPLYEHATFAELEAFAYAIEAEVRAATPVAQPSAEPPYKHIDDKTEDAGPNVISVKEMIAGAWCAGYYDAGYTHDSAYAHKKADEFAAAAMNELAGAGEQPSEAPSAQPFALAWFYPDGKPYTLTWAGEDAKRVVGGGIKFRSEPLYRALAPIPGEPK